jgi:anion-transporting  ArsA/GET3 family ATPase
MSATSPGEQHLLDRRLLFVTGKGGVGKTTLACALAEVAARRGRTTLLCEMDAKGAIAASFDAGTLGFAPREIRPNLFAMAMNTEDSLREYLRLFVRVPLVGRLGPLARTFDFVADAAPGVKEILAIGKLCYEVRERHYDLVIADAEATGHIVAQVGAPHAIRDLVHVGLVRDQTEWMIQLLRDPLITGLVAVTTAEEMPVVETGELLHRVTNESEVNVLAVVANRLLPGMFADSDQRIFDTIRTDDHADLINERFGRGASTVLDAVAQAQARAQVGAGHLAELRHILPAGVPLVLVPELFARGGGRRVVHQVAEALAEEGV